MSLREREHHVILLSGRHLRHLAAFCGGSLERWAFVAVLCCGGCQSAPSVRLWLDTAPGRIPFNELTPDGQWKTVPVSFAEVARGFHTDTEGQSWFVWQGRYDSSPRLCIGRTTAECVLAASLGPVNPSDRPSRIDVSIHGYLYHGILQIPDYHVSLNDRGTVTRTQEGSCLRLAGQVRYELEFFRGAGAGHLERIAPSVDIEQWRQGSGFMQAQFAWSRAEMRRDAGTAILAQYGLVVQNRTIQIDPQRIISVEGMSQRSRGEMGY